MLTEEKITARLNVARSSVEKKLARTPDLGVILGSGLGKFVENMTERTIIPYEDIPGFPLPTAPGHKGNLALGNCGPKYAMVMQGRLHYYEGYDMEEVTFPARLMEVLGVKKLIVTNAAGGINESYKPGQLVIMRDHINLLGVNPLRGRNLDFLGPRFPDMTYAYDKNWRAEALAVLKEMGRQGQEGVYAAVPGPSFETPAEIRYLRAIGADLVGMSTVPEVIVANHGGMKVLGISCVTNMAAGVLERKLTMEEVLETSARAAGDLYALLSAVLARPDGGAAEH
ncbi:MAG: purine-nucleoside phosphorylase [Gracilibacteraceae bacterium]|jgi:purine-nucleoside phosphorylase|nr:purine-nucleoside phosphorylase [Gracilibacteraceae bacterium]